jgi:hypothetical protein
MKVNSVVFVICMHVTVTCAMRHQVSFAPLPTPSILCCCVSAAVWSPCKRSNREDQRRGKECVQPVTIIMVAINPFLQTPKI